VSWQKDKGKHALSPTESNASLMHACSAHATSSPDGHGCSISIHTFFFLVFKNLSVE
jgi:hypothetical protein